MAIAPCEEGVNELFHFKFFLLEVAAVLRVLMTQSCSGVSFAALVHCALSLGSQRRVRMDDFLMSLTAFLLPTLPCSVIGLYSLVVWVDEVLVYACHGNESAFECFEYECFLVEFEVEAGCEVVEDVRG